MDARCATQIPPGLYPEFGTERERGACAPLSWDFASVTGRAAAGDVGLDGAAGSLVTEGSLAVGVAG